MPRVTNPSIAKELMFTAEVIDGKKAQEVGVANHCVTQNEAGDAAYQKCLEIAERIVPNASSVCIICYCFVLCEKTG